MAVAVAVAVAAAATVAMPIPMKAVNSSGSRSRGSDSSSGSSGGGGHFRCPAVHIPPTSVDVIIHHDICMFQVSTQFPSRPPGGKLHLFISSHLFSIISTHDISWTRIHEMLNLGIQISRIRYFELNLMIT